MNSQSNRARRDRAVAPPEAPASNIVLMDRGFMAPCEKPSTIPQDVPAAPELTRESQAVFLPPQTITRALGLPELRSLLPTAAGFCSDVLEESGRHGTGNGLPQATFIYCIQGVAWCEIRGRRQEIREGKLLIVSGAAPYVCGTDSHRPGRFAWVRVMGTNLDQMVNQFGAMGRSAVFNLGRETQLQPLFENLLQLMEMAENSLQVGEACRNLENLLSTMIHSHAKRNTSVREADRKIEQSIAYMKEHLDAPLHVGTLAALVSVSPSHYFALFKRRTGTAPIDYFIRLRMRQACHLLNATTMSVKEVAATLGYEDPYYFSRMFKSVNEMPPSNYRALKRNAPDQSADKLELMEAVSA